LSVFNLYPGGEVMKQITTLGIDLAKSVFMVHGVDAAGDVVLHKMVRREKLMELVAALPPCLIGLEACGGAHEWARLFQRYGHRVGIMMARFVVPYRKSSKNDGNDAEAICEAVARRNMRFVPVKSAEQQAVLSLHRVRQGFVEERTATINRIRGLLAEFGIVLPQRAAQVRRAAVVVAQDLPVLAREAIADLRAHLNYLDGRIEHYERQLVALARQCESARRIQTMPGVGPLTASAITASIASGHEFANGRQFAAWLGLVPRQHSTGGKMRLGRITKRGDAYLRTLLMLGARAVLQNAAQKTDRLSRWAVALYSRRGYHRSIIAIAAKNARIIWALLAKNRTFSPAI
jgi:transposase